MAGFDRLGDEQAEVGVVAGLGQAVKVLAGGEIVTHFFEAGGNGYFVVHQTGGNEGVLIIPLISREVAFVIVTFQISWLPSVLSREMYVDRGLEVGEIGGLQVVDFSSLASDQEAMRADPGAILISGEIVNPQLVSELQMGDDLGGGNDFFCRGQGGAGPSVDEGGGKGEGVDDGGPKTNSQESAEEDRAMVIVGHRDLRLSDRAELARGNEREPGGMQGLKGILFGDLDPGMFGEVPPQALQVGQITSRWCLGQHRHIVRRQFQDQVRADGSGDRKDDKIRLGLDERPQTGTPRDPPVVCHLGAGGLRSRIKARDAETIRQRLGHPQKKLCPPASADQAKGDSFIHKLF